MKIIDLLKQIDELDINLYTEIVLASDEEGNSFALMDSIHKTKDQAVFYPGKTIEPPPIDEKEYQAWVLDNDLGKVCPKCNKVYTLEPALSRRDNKTHICPECGVAEAMEDFQKSKLK